MNRATHEWEDETIARVAEQPLRLALLEEAAILTGGDRNKAYGDPVPNMQHIADIFNAISGHKVTARDAALFHVATKLARLYGNATHRDSHVDGMAYLGIAFECATAATQPASPVGAVVEAILQEVRT